MLQARQFALRIYFTDTEDLKKLNNMYSLHKETDKRLALNKPQKLKGIILQETHLEKRQI